MSVASDRSVSRRLAISIDRRQTEPATCSAPDGATPSTRPRYTAGTPTRSLAHAARTLAHFWLLSGRTSPTPPPLAAVVTPCPFPGFSTTAHSLSSSVVLVRGQGVSDHRHFVRLGIEQPTVKVIDLRRRPPAAGQGWRAVSAVEFAVGLVVLLLQQRIDPAAIARHLRDDGRHLAVSASRRRCTNPAAWTLPSAARSTSSRIARPVTSTAASSTATAPARAPHDTGPPSASSSAAAASSSSSASASGSATIAAATAVAGSPAGRSRRRPIRQQQFRPAPPRFLLLAGQPVPQGRHQVVVGQLVVFLDRHVRLRTTESPARFSCLRGRSA